jgi:hypothetical protein
MAKLIDPIGVDHAWMSEIGCGLTRIAHFSVPFS